MINMNKFLKRFLQGLLLGLAIIAAVGGGTMAVLIGVYDDLLDAVNNLRKDFKKSFNFLLPIALGMVVSIGILFYPIKLLLEHFPFITIAFFAGVTSGGLRIFASSLRGSFNWKNLLLSLVGFLFVFAIGAFSYFSTMQADLVNINWIQLLSLFLIGFICMGVHVSPGISGTFLLIAFGYYEELINFVVRLVKFDFVSVGFDLGALFIFLIGSVLGVLVIAKLYRFFFKKIRVKTNFAILGFIVGSIVIAFFNGKLRPLYESPEPFQVTTLIFSIVAFIIGAVISFFLLGIVNKKKKEETPEIGEEEIV